MEPIASTAEILCLRMLNKSIDKQWIDWAYDMLVAGFDTENLVMLAGELEPLNQFEMQRLVDKTFVELRLKWDNKELVLCNYACYIINKVLSGEFDSPLALEVLKNVYLDMDYQPLFYDFYLLYHAKYSLDNYGFQYYWEDATRENMDDIIRNYFDNWKKKYGDF